MTISDETLMAFSDGELTGEERAAVERAIQENPELEKRVARHRALRDRIKLAYSAELSEPVPERLLAAARRAGPAPTSGKIVNLNEARAAMVRQAARDDSRAANDESSFKPGWRSLGGIAAGILLGLGVGYGLWQQGSGPIARNADGAWIASGQLKSALTAQLAAEQTPTSRVHIGISFRDKAGEYCRSFALSGAAAPVGVACHHGADWQIQSLMKGQAGEGGGQYRTAGTQMPALLLKSIEAQIAGEPLDQAAEAAARQQGWQAAAR
jgi:anti-sigma-K factor RskA